MRAALFVLLTLSVFVRDVAAQPSFGPLPGQEAGPLQRLGFSHTFEGADLVESGVLQVESRIAYANIFEQDSAATHELFIDLERLTNDVGLRWGLTDRIELGGRLSFETTGGGVLDDFIWDWHRKIGMPNANRGKYPFGVYSERLVDGEGRVLFDLPKRTFGLEDARLSLKWRAWRSRDGQRLVSVSSTARFPARSPAGSKRGDLALSARARASWTRWHLHAAAGGATSRAARDFDDVLRPYAFFADLAAERNLAAWLTAVAQISMESPRMQGFDDPELDGWPINLVLGAIGQVGDAWHIDVSLQEDVPASSPAADFTIAVGVRRSW